MILNSLPDVKSTHEFLTVGQDYKIIRIIGNGVVIQTSKPDLQILIVATRLDGFIEEQKSNNTEWWQQCKILFCTADK